MNTKELRQIACAAVRSQLRRSGFTEQEIASASMREVEGALDTIQRTAPDTYAAQYYALVQAADDLSEWRRFTLGWKNGIQ